jgi:hypothetical protein
MNNPQREKRAYIAYLSELMRKQFIMKVDEVDGNPIHFEIQQVEKHINDLDFLIRVKECEMET